MRSPQKHRLNALHPLALLRDAKRVGYVFSGGSSRCAFQIGVIEALAELGVRPALAIGVSAGAWNAALVAARRESRLMSRLHQLSLAEANPPAVEATPQTKAKAATRTPAKRATAAAETVQQLPVQMVSASRAHLFFASVPADDPSSCGPPEALDESIGPARSS